MRAEIRERIDGLIVQVSRPPYLDITPILARDPEAFDAAGGTVRAAARLVERAGASVAGIAVFLETTLFPARAELEGERVFGSCGCQVAELSGRPEAESMRAQS